MLVYPFDELAAGGWVLTDLRGPQVRPGLPGKVFVADLKDRSGRLMTVDVDDRDRMRGHATFSHGEEHPLLFAMSTRATAILGGSDPDADYLVLAAIKDVLTLDQLRKHNAH